MPFGFVVRPEARCVYCGSLERHRLVWLFLEQRTDLFDARAKRVLHVAPEPCLEERLRERLGLGYLTADLHDPAAMVRMDITSIDFPPDTFDVIYCSHVLEHVDSDRAALSEFYRVLKPSAWALLLVPIIAAETFEAPEVTDPAERLRLFGQEDHVRAYGPDYVDRLRGAGFEVEVLQPLDLVGPDEILRLGLTNGAGSIFYCTKR